MVFEQYQPSERSSARRGGRSRGASRGGLASFLLKRCRRRAGRLLFAIRTGRSKVCAVSVEQTEATIEAMPVSGRRKFVRWFDEHRHELIGEADEVSPAGRAELELRLKAMDEHPGLPESFEETDAERMFKEIADAHAQKTPARKG